MTRALLTTLALGCAADSEGTAGTETDTPEPGTTEAGTTEPGTTEPGTTEPGTTGAAEDEDLEHGTVRITLTPAENVEGNPFLGTAQIRVVMDYDACLQNFYESNPEYQQDGAIGETVFGTRDGGGEGWADRLCEDPAAQQVPCDAALIEQELDNAKQLRVTYSVTSTDLETKYIPFGPVPLANLAMCEAGAQPRVSLTPNPVTGIDANGDTIWNTVTFDNAQAVPNQGADIVVRIAPI